MIIVIPILPTRALAIWPFIILKKRKDLDNAIILNHERIHLRQQLELLFFGFFLAYFFHFIYLRVFTKLSGYDAYRAILFEKEAFRHQSDQSYLSTRKFYNYV